MNPSPTERVVMEDGGVGDVGQLGEVPDNVVESVARRPHLHKVASLLGGQVRPLPAHGVIDRAGNEHSQCENFAKVRW